MTAGRRRSGVCTNTTTVQQTTVVGPKVLVPGSVGIRFSTKTRPPACITIASASNAADWNLRSSILYDTSDNQFDAASIQLGFKPGKGRIFNLGYTLREPPPSLLNRPVTEQANFSAYYPINDNWSVFGAIE